MKKNDLDSASENMNTVINFLEKQSQYTLEFPEENLLSLTQNEDLKKINIKTMLIEKVMVRVDSEANEFLQVNFNHGHKILITKSLVGFKPHELVGFDISRIPRVVTTMDLVSVSKAIEDLFDIEETPDTRAEIEVLKRVYQSILVGAENIGFKMCAEKKWISSLLLSNSSIVA